MELDGIRSLKTELKGQTSCLRAKVRALEAELAVISRYRMLTIKGSTLASAT